MTTLLIFCLPFVFALALIILKFRLDLRKPSPLAFGCIIPKVCIVDSEEVMRYCSLAEEEEDSVPGHLRREARRKRVRIYWTFVRQMIWDTRLFQQALRFEQMKIDPAKPSLDYEQRETLIMSLVDEAADLRRELVNRQYRLVLNTVLRSRLDYKALNSLLGIYKRLEEDIINLVAMAEDSTYRDMLIDRLGLSNWRIINGGGPDPDPESA